MDITLEEKKYIKRKEKAIAEGNRIQQAINCNRLGDIYNERGHYQIALKEYEEEAQIYEKLHKPLEMSRAHRMAGEMLMMLGVFDEAKIHITKYLENVSALNNTVEEQRAYTTLGRLHLLHGQSLSDVSLTQTITQLREAERAFLKSLLLTNKLCGLVSKMELLDMQARCYLNIGIVKEHLDDFNESVMYIEKAIKISKAHDIYELTHQCYISLSLMYHAKKNDACSALRFCNQALEVAKCLPQKVKRICETLIIKAEILIKEGEFSSAKQVLTKAYRKNTPNENDRKNIIKSLKSVIKLCRLLDNLVTTSSTDYAECKRLYEKLGDVCCNLGNYKKALEYYLQMYECAKQNQESGKSLIPIYVSLYQTYKDDKQYERALEFLWKEYEVRKDEAPEACSTLLGIAEVCELQGQTFWSIQDVYRQALEQASKVKDVKVHIQLEKIAYLRLRKLQEKHGMNVLAEELTKEANEKGIDLESTTEDSDSDFELSLSESENRTPNSDDDDFHLSTLSGSDVSDSDERENFASTRTKRGTRPFVIKRNNKGETQLHQACISGNVELVRHLVDQGHALNVRDHAGWLPLHEACNHGYREIVEFLLDRGALSSINDKGGTSCDGITPLYDASSNGFLDVVELLLDRGADVTLKTDFGESCLDALDKWRRVSTLTDGEQMHYKTLRIRMLKSLSVVTGLQLPSKCKTVSLYDDNDDTSDDGKDESDVQSNTFPITTYHTHENASAKQDRRNSFYKNLKKHPCNEGTVSQIKETRALSDEDAYEDVEYMKPNKKKRCHQTKLRSHLLSSETFSSSKPLCDSLTHKNNEMQMCMHTATDSKKKSIKSHSFSDQCSVEHTNVEKRNYEKENKALEELIASAEPDSTTAFIQQSPAQIVPPPLIASTVSFKVKVEDEFFLVPIEHNKLNDTNMCWLADEVSKRYYDSVGLKPLLRLKTVDGFAYADTDCVNVALQHNIIIGSVIEWQTAPLGQRFEEVCGSLQLYNHTEIKNELEKGELSNVVQLKDFWLNPKQCQAIFKCLMHQKNIRILDLTNNFMQNEGCTQLAKCLPTLTHLRSINLKGNYIEADGLQELLTSLSNTTKQISIEELILTQNPLGNVAVCLIDRFCNTTAGQNLKKLHLSNCNITQLNNSFKWLSQLIDFDISFNSLTYDALLKMLKHLNANLLQNLNMSFCQNASSSMEMNNTVNENENNSIGDIIMSFFENGTCCRMQYIRLANCQLSDIHIYKIVQRLAKSDDLMLLDISHNEKLYSTTLFLIFNQLPQLRKLIALNCKDFLKLDDDITRLEHLKSIPHFIMISKFPYLHDNSVSDVLEFKHIFYMYWKEKAKMEIFHNFVVFYINDNDLNQYL